MTLTYGTPPPITLLEDKVGIEEYSYQKVKKFFLDEGKTVLDFPLDEEGVCIKEDVDLLYTTPYNQFPLGIVMSKRRKNEIQYFICRYPCGSSSAFTDCLRHNTVPGNI